MRGAISPALVVFVLACAACAGGRRGAPHAANGARTPPVYTVSDTTARFAPGVIATGSVFGATLPSDGGVVYFTRVMPDGSGTQIMQSVWTGAGWSVPQRASFSTGAHDQLPQLSPGGSELTFSAPRRRGAALSDTDGDWDIWRVKLDGQSIPVRDASPANTPADEMSPSESFDGTMFFARAVRGDTTASTLLYWSPRLRSSPVAVSVGREVTRPLTPFVSRSGRVLLLSALPVAPGPIAPSALAPRPRADLYVMVRRGDGRWSTPRALGREVNSTDTSSRRRSPLMNGICSSRASASRRTVPWGPISTWCRCGRCRCCGTHWRSNRKRGGRFQESAPHETSAVHRDDPTVRSQSAVQPAPHFPERPMPMVTTRDGLEIFYKDLGPRDAQPVVLHHGWPLSSDDWDAQVLFFLANGYRVVAHDRRGHGRSTQGGEGHDMDHYAADAAAVTTALDLRNAVHIGHSTGGGEALHYTVQHGAGRVAKLVLIGAVPPIMLQSASNPDGVPMAVFDSFRAALANNRAQFFLDIPTGPFYGYNRPGATPLEGVIRNWWRQGMAGGAKAHYDGIKAFSETDFTADLKVVTVPTLVMHGADDQVVPIANSAHKSITHLKHGTLKVYEGLSHGMCTTHPELVNADLLAFIRS